LIGTHDFSLLPGGDWCSHMLPKKVSTTTKITDADEGESRSNFAEMVDAAIQASQLIDVSELWDDVVD
jgi:thiamine biosynthesis protein ThiI